MGDLEESKRQVSKHCALVGKTSNTRSGTFFGNVVLIAVGNTNTQRIFISLRYTTYPVLTAMPERK
jgi:hypothetical protein